MWGVSGCVLRQDVGKVGSFGGRQLGWREVGYGRGREEVGLGARRLAGCVLRQDVKMVFFSQRGGVPGGGVWEGCGRWGVGRGTDRGMWCGAWQRTWHVV